MIQSNQITITLLEGSTCNCPAGEVCANANGTCPSNSFPDEYNAGCCIPCSQLIPSNIINVNTTPANLYFYTNVYDESVHNTCPSNLSGCKTNDNCTGEIVITGKLIDSAGHGICNQEIVAKPNETPMTFNADYSGLCLAFSCSESFTYYFYPQMGSAYTDNNGDFTIKIYITGGDVSVQSATTNDLLNPGCYENNNPATLNVLYTLSAANGIVQAIASAQVIFNSAISKPS